MKKLLLAGGACAALLALSLPARSQGIQMGGTVAPGGNCPTTAVVSAGQTRTIYMNSLGQICSNAVNNGGTVGVLPYPTNATPIAASTGIVANTATGVTLPAVVGKTTYISGLQITGSGATAASNVTVSILLSGSSTGLYYVIPIPASTTASITPLTINFNPALSSGAPNSTISVNMGAFGSGNTAEVVTAEGYEY
jgi:hypothetical protein